MPTVVLLWVRLLKGVSERIGEGSVDFRTRKGTKFHMTRKRMEEMRRMRSFNGEILLTFSPGPGETYLMINTSRPVRYGPDVFFVVFASWRGYNWPE